MNINLVFPMAGLNHLSEELGYPYPAPLVEIHGKTLIELVINQFDQLPYNIFYTFIVSKKDCLAFSLDKSILSACSNKSINIVSLDKPTDGALCSTMMAIDVIEKNNPIIISNYDQLFSNKLLFSFLNDVIKDEVSAAIPVFESHHPRWSYILNDKNNLKKVIEVAEKIPLSSYAIAGLYYFKSSSVFFEIASKTLYNERNYNNKYYISSVINEYILSKYEVISKKIDNDGYFSLYTGQRILDFEKCMSQKQILDLISK